MVFSGIIFWSLSLGLRVRLTDSDSDFRAWSLALVSRALTRTGRSRSLTESPGRRPVTQAKTQTEQLVTRHGTGRLTVSRTLRVADQQSAIRLKSINSRSLLSI